jgi:hypothetical protein
VSGDCFVDIGGIGESAKQKIVIENVEKMLTKHMVSNSAVSHKKQRWRPFNAIHVSDQIHPSYTSGS